MSIIKANPVTEADTFEQMIWQMADEAKGLTIRKNRSYGDSFNQSGTIVRVLYPEGIKPEQMDDALTVIRIIDKLFRIARRAPDSLKEFGESPYRDILGYGLLGAARDELRVSQGR